RVEGTLQSSIARRCIQCLQSPELRSSEREYQQYVNSRHDHVGKQHANVPTTHSRVRSQVQLLTAGRGTLWHDTAASCESSLLCPLIDGDINDSAIPWA